MINPYYAEKMMAERSREMAEVQLGAQRAREAMAIHDAPHFSETTLPTSGEARLFHTQGRQTTASRRTVRLGPLVIGW
jgi:hypothetical protein